MRFQTVRRVKEVATTAAVGGIRCRCSFISARKVLCLHTAYCPRLVQCWTNTTADKKYPRITFTTTPIVNAQNGRAPELANSRTRVVSPMLKKQKMNAQVRRFLIGATTSGVSTFR